MATEVTAKTPSRMSSPLEHSESVSANSCGHPRIGYNIAYPSSYRVRKSRYFYHLVVALVVCGFASFTMSQIKDSVIANWTELRTAKEKLDIVWERFTSNLESEPWLGLVELLVRGFFLQTDETEKITNRNTFRPFPDKKKVLHTQGAHVKIKWKATPNSLGYTGLLGDDDVDGTLTFSKGSRILSNTSASWGMGMKLLRDNGPPAASVFCSPSTLLGQVTSLNWNMFDAPLCGHVDIFIGAILLSMARKRPQTGLKDTLWTGFGNGPGVSNLADLTKVNGTVAVPNFPFTMCLRAPLSLAEQHRGAKAWYNPIELLRYVPAGTMLYDVLAIDSPKFLADILNIQTNAVKIAEIWTQSEFTRSRWADNHWTHQHQKFEEDLSLRPDWKPYMTLNYLILDGYAYMPLFSDRPNKGTMEQAISSFAPGLIGVLQVLTNPTALYQFLTDDIGVQYLQTAMQSVILGLSNSSDSTIRSLREVDESVDLTEPLKAKQLKGKTSKVETLVRHLEEAGLFPGVPAYRSSSEVLPQKEVENIMMDEDGVPFHLEEHLREHNVTEERRRQTMNFVENVAPHLTYDGHFIRPADPGAVFSLIQDPLMRELSEVVLQRYYEQFGSDFMTDFRDAAFGGPGVTDLESFVRTIFMEDQPSSVREATGGPRGSLKRAQEKADTNTFRDLVKRVMGPMEQLGKVKMFADVD